MVYGNLGSQHADLTVELWFSNCQIWVLPTAAIRYRRDMRGQSQLVNRQAGLDMGLSYAQKQESSVDVSALHYEDIILKKGDVDLWIMESLAPCTA